MKRMLLFIGAFLFTLLSTAQNNRLLDHPMQIKKISISVEADCFTAITFLEMEFYNPNDKEIEGLYRFNLLPGQVVTAFQLELNGKYRDGSIEEKWKARNAYNTIVGKRIDPALLTMEYGNSYRLNIYPVLARSSRRITMTIHQTLPEEKDKLYYRFGFNKTDTAKQFQLSIKTIGCRPITGNGLIANNIFQNKGNTFFLETKKENIALWQSVSFYFPNNAGTPYCTQTKNGLTYFALRAHHSIPEKLPLHPKKLQVYWDASGSSAKRNTSKEISFLKQYLQKHDVNELIITKFSDEISFSMKFYPRRNKDWIIYLQSIQYDGATRMDQLNLPAVSADVIFLFTDGYVSYGSKTFACSIKPMFAIATSATQDSSFLKALIGQSGGAFINLNNHSITSAIEKTSFATNQLISIESLTGKTIFERTMRTGKDSFLLYGTLPDDDILTFTYGNSSSIYKTEKISLKKYTNCDAVGIDRLSMLHRFATLSQWYNWEDILEFGLKEKIVTYNTAYIVLERIEDYVKYNITPPKELEEECKQQGFITKDSKTWRQKLRDMDDLEIFNGVVNVYNLKLKAWDANSVLISLTRQDFEKANYIASAENTSTLYGSSHSFGLTQVDGSMNEVVVTALGSSIKKREISYSTTTIPRNMLVGNTVEQALSGKVAGLQVISYGSVGSPTQIRIRGINTLSGNNQALMVLDGFPVEGNINELISIQDIENITVLKSPSASVIYGSRGANGVIVVTSKKYKHYSYYRYNNNRYRLKDMEDVEYLKEIKTVAISKKRERYNLLKRQYDTDAIFYIDMAQHFFESGLTAEAMKILMNAAEASNGDPSVLTAIGYSFENWKKFDKAADIYTQLLFTQPTNLATYRDLAWAQYQDGKIQQAIESFYTAIKLNLETAEQHHLDQKASMLNEMNAIINIHKDSLDLSKIPSSLLNNMPVDMRIVLSSNQGYVYGMKIIEPNGKECSGEQRISKNGGTLENGNAYYGYANEYYIKNALKGKYRISINHYDYYESSELTMVRIVCFKNFGKKDQTISVENVIMNNQNGTVEIGKTEW